METPSERLGAGRDFEDDNLTHASSGNGYLALKNHEFFTTSTVTKEGGQEVAEEVPLPWGSLHLLTAPYIPKSMPSSVMRDGASDAWYYESASK